MNKQEVSEIIKSDLNPDSFNTKNGGNVKFANINNGPRKVYWLNIHIDERLSEDYHLILNNENEKKFIYIKIPPNTLKEELFKTRFDKTNNKDKFDIEISYENSTYLIDTKSGEARFDFNPYLVKKYSY